MKQRFFQKDITKGQFWLCVAVIFALKFGLSRFQMFYTWIDGAPLDDELMFRAAQSITAGQWLGAYDYLTLSKAMFFPVWLAATHLLRLPYLGAIQLLWCGASLVTALAFAPVIQQYKGRLALFAALAFCPSAIASFNLRVYRDSIFPAFCLLFFAGIIGFALRCLDRKCGWQWLIPAGVGLSCAWLCREDGFWLLPFGLAGSVILAFFLVREKHGARIPLLALPYGILGLAVAVFCGLNYAHYGVFTTSDFSSGSFSDAVGALTRVKEEEFIHLVTIPREVRLAVYNKTDCLDSLQYWLEEDAQMQNDFVNPTLGDYQAGSFYWAIRRAAQFEGVYDSAAKAEAFWAQAAEEINAACDSGELPSEGKRRSGTTPAIRSEYVLPVVEEGLHSLWFCLTFQDCDPYYDTLRSIGLPEDLAVWEGYLRERCNVAAQAGTDLPYYSPYQKLVYLGLNLVRYGYAVLLPLAFALALVLQVRKGLALLKNSDSRSALCWWLLLGLLGMAVLRAFIIAFMEVASFHIGTYVMYLATVHPLLLIYSVMGIQTGWEVRPWQK